MNENIIIKIKEGNKMNAEVFYRKEDGSLHISLLQPGDIITYYDTKDAIEDMKKLANAGYHAVLHNIWNDNICTSVEIISIPKENV